MHQTSGQSPNQEGSQTSRPSLNSCRRSAALFACSESPWASRGSRGERRFIGNWGSSSRRTRRHFGSRGSLDRLFDNDSCLLHRGEERRQHLWRTELWPSSQYLAILYVKAQASLLDGRIASSWSARRAQSSSSCPRFRRSSSWCLFAAILFLFPTHRAGWPSTSHCTVDWRRQLIWGNHSWTSLPRFVHTFGPCRCSCRTGTALSWRIWAWRGPSTSWNWSPGDFFLQAPLATWSGACEQSFPSTSVRLVQTVFSLTCLLVWGHLSSSCWILRRCQPIPQSASCSCWWQSSARFAASMQIYLLSF